jgi:hypothetical protein
MISNIVPLFKPGYGRRDWSPQEIAEFYRVENSLARAGISVSIDRGLSDEDDPWFIFCNAETGDVIIHFARIDGLYVVASAAIDRCMRGADFRSLIESLIECHPLVITKASVGTKVTIHPAAILVALVMTCFLKLTQTEAFASPSEKGEAHISPTTKLDHTTTEDSGSIIVDERHSSMVLTAIAFALRESETQETAIFSAAGIGDPIQPPLAPISEHAGTGPDLLNASVVAFEMLGRSSANAQSVFGVISIDEVATSPIGVLPQFRAIPEGAFIQTSGNFIDNVPVGLHSLTDPPKISVHNFNSYFGNGVYFPVLSSGVIPANGSIGVGLQLATNTPKAEVQTNSLGGNSLDGPTNANDLHVGSVLKHSSSADSGIDSVVTSGQISTNPPSQALPAIDGPTNANDLPVGSVLKHPSSAEPGIDSVVTSGQISINPAWEALSAINEATSSPVSVQVKGTSGSTIANESSAPSAATNTQQLPDAVNNVSADQTPPKLDGLSGTQGVGAISEPTTTTSTPESSQASDNGKQTSTHWVSDLSGAQTQFVFNLAEHPGNAVVPAAFSLVDSPTSIKAFNQAIETFIVDHPDYKLFSWHNEVVIYDSHLGTQPAAQPSMASWSFTDGSEVIIIGISQNAPLGHEVA